DRAGREIAPGASSGAHQPDDEGGAERRYHATRAVAKQQASARPVEYIDPIARTGRRKARGAAPAHPDLRQLLTAVAPDPEIAIDDVRIGRGSIEEIFDDRNRGLVDVGQLKGDDPPFGGCARALA